MKSGIFFWN